MLGRAHQVRTTICLLYIPWTVLAVVLWHFSLVCVLQKDDRDTAYAQAYLNKVKVAMQKDPNTYLQFMDLLRQFEINKLSPVEVGLSGF